MKIIILTLFLIIILSITGLCGEAEIKPIVLTADNFQEVLESDKLVIIDFWAKWCRYCKLLDPVIIRLMIFNQRYNKDKIEWYKVDVDKDRKFLNNFRPFRGLPVVAFYKNGKEVDRMIGFQPFLTIQDKINLLLKEEKKDKKDKKDDCRGGVCPPPLGY